MGKWCGHVTCHGGCGVLWAAERHELSFIRVAPFHALILKPNLHLQTRNSAILRTFHLLRKTVDLYNRRPCSDFMDMLRRLISCRIINIIIIINNNTYRQDKLPVPIHSFIHSFIRSFNKNTVKTQWLNNMQRKQKQKKQNVKILKYHI